MRSSGTIARRTLLRLHRDARGLALLEFALTLPLVMMIGGYGIELSNLALTNLRISQYALNLADTASRVGLVQGSNVTQLREADVDDVFQGIRLESGSTNLGTNGRVTLSSLENVQQSYDKAPVQRIHWQRCFGLKSGSDFTSHYGTTKATDGSTASSANAGTQVSGMGPSGAIVTAPTNTGVMFVEVNYQYKPLFGSMFLGSTPRIIRYTASLIVRDNRDFTQIYNPSPAATQSTCDQYTT